MYHIDAGYGQMSIKAPRPSRGATIAVVTSLVWSLYWAGVVWTDVISHTELGRMGLSGGISPHQAFEVLFTAAHGGIRWAAGSGLILLAWGGARLRNARGRHAPGVTSTGRTAMVTGD